MANDSGSHLNHRDLAAEAPVNLCEFETHIAAPYDDQVRRQKIDFNHRRIRQIAGLIEPRYGRNPGASAHVDEDAISLEPLRSDAHHVGGHKAGVALIYGAVLHRLEMIFETLRGLADDPVF